MMRGSYQFPSSSNNSVPQYNRDMLNAGQDVVPDSKNAKRSKQGLCPTCGTQQTHKVGVFRGKKIPLTIEGKVLNGQCLLCHPVEGYIRRPGQSSSTSSPIPISDALPSSPERKRPNKQSNFEHEAPVRYNSQPPPGAVLAPEAASAHHQSQATLGSPTPQQLQTSFAMRKIESPMQVHDLSYHHTNNTLPSRRGLTLNGYPHMGSGAMQGLIPTSYEMPHDSMVVPRTLEVFPDDTSVVSQITMDVRLMDDDATVPPLPGRRPGPEHFESNWDLGRPGRVHSSYQYGPMGSMRPVNQPEMVIEEDEEYQIRSHEEGTPPTPLGLEPSRGGFHSGGGGFDPEFDFNILLNGPRGRSSDSRAGRGASAVAANINSSSDEIVFRPNDHCAMGVALVQDTQTASAEAIGKEKSRREIRISPHLDDGPSIMGESKAEPVNIVGPINTSNGDYSSRKAQENAMNHQESQTTLSSEPPLRELDARGRADSGKVLDPVEAEIRCASPDQEYEGKGSRSKAWKKKPSSLKRRNKKGEVKGMAARASEPAVDSSTTDIEKTPASLREDTKDVTATESEVLNKKKHSKTTTKKIEKKRLRQQKEDMHEIPTIMHCLALDECNSHMRERALASLAAILWRSSDKGREFIVDHNGIETLNKAMWADMESPGVQSAAMHLILAMAASPDGIVKNDMLAGQDSICDSILFTMQNHSSVPEIQLRGCLVFACLSGASSDNKSISDGSLSGAVTMVLMAMNQYPKNSSIQKAGMQALYHQCLASVHAEGNKRTLMKSKLENGVLGLEIVLGAIEELQDDYNAMEWAFAICWCLTSSEDLVKDSSEIPLHEAIVPICDRHMQNSAAMGLIEAGLGTIGNLAHLEQMHESLESVGAVGVILNSLHTYPNDFGISYEAIAAIANLSVSAHARHSFVKSGAVPLAIASIKHFLDIPEYSAEGLRALACLSSHSEEAKEMMRSTTVIKILSDAREMHNTLAVQNLCCVLISTLAVDRTTCDFLARHRATRVILSAMGNFLDLNVQEAGCLGLRNLFHHILLTDKLLEIGDTLQLLLNAMGKHKSSFYVQKDACSALWNMIYKAEDPAKVATSDVVRSIVKAMQSHMECNDLLEQACGVLWTIFDESIERKKDVTENGIIDALTCAIVMHPRAPVLLETACGVLSSLSSEAPLAEAIVNSQGVSIVVETLRNNNNSISLLEVGCLTLRNTAFFVPDVVEEVSPVIATVINAMQNDLGNVDFQKEACNLLWILAAEDERCQSKILGLDGLSVLMECMEENRDDIELQKSARAAFNRLSFASHLIDG